LNVHEKYMQKCLELAALGLRNAMPNPGVGAILVYNDKIIGQGHTQGFGGNHAEVEAIRNVKDKDLIGLSTLYVSLEPCSHFGKTPPCSDLIIRSGIKTVVIGCKDPFKEVNGSGIAKLKKEGITVVKDVLEDACINMNKRFFTFHRNKRPHILLKWAQSADGFMDRERTKKETGVNWITQKETQALTHKWRSDEAAIIVGSNTARIDNPSLTVRAAEGTNPLRIVLDRKGTLVPTLSLFNNESRTLVFTENKDASYAFAEPVLINFNQLIPAINAELYKRNILSLMVEGGAQLLSSFIQQKNWDEARIITGEPIFKKGIKAPSIDDNLLTMSEQFGKDLIQYYHA